LNNKKLKNALKKIFLESHHVKNLFFGFGQFNYSLIKGLSTVVKEEKNLKFCLNVKDKSFFKKKFGELFLYKKYKSTQRYKPFRIKKKYDLWHSLNQNTKIEPFFNIPYLLTVHDVNFIEETSKDMSHEVNIRFQKKLDRSCAITYISSFAKESTHRYFKVPNVPEYIIYNGNPIDKVTIEESYEPVLNTDFEFVFSIGECTKRKNMMSLVKMISLTEDLHLVLAGKDTTDYAKELKQLVVDLNLEDRVHVLGKISEIDKQFFYKNCKAFVFPSLREGFGIPPIEAMSFGKPVFLSNNTSLPEIGGEKSFYWDHYEPEYMLSVFKKGMEKYDNNKEEFQNWYRERALFFNWEKTAKGYLKVYKDILKS